MNTELNAIDNSINLDSETDSDEDYDTDETPLSQHTSDDDWIDDDCEFCDIKCGSINMFNNLWIINQNRELPEFEMDYKLLCMNLANCDT